MIRVCRSSEGIQEFADRIMEMRHGCPKRERPRHANNKGGRRMVARSVLTMWLNAIEADVVGGLRKLFECALLVRLPQIRFPLDTDIRGVLSTARPELEDARNHVAAIAGFLKDSPTLTDVIDGIAPDSSVNWEREFLEILMSIYLRKKAPARLDYDNLPSFRSTVQGVFLFVFREFTTSLLWARVLACKDGIAVGDFAVHIREFVKIMQALMPDVSIARLVREGMTQWTQSIAGKGADACIQRVATEISNATLITDLVSACGQPRSVSLFDGKEKKEK